MNYKSYELERTVYTIVWFTRQIREKMYQRSLISTSQVSDTEKGESLALYPHKLFFLNPFYLNEDNSQINLGRSIIEKATKLIDDDELIPQERMSIMDERDYENMREREREEGLQKGGQNKALEIARNLLAEGLDPAIVAKTRGAFP